MYEGMYVCMYICAQHLHIFLARKGYYDLLGRGLSCEAAAWAKDRKDFVVKAMQAARGFWVRV